MPQPHQSSSLSSVLPHPAPSPHGPKSHTQATTPPPPPTRQVRQAHLPSKFLPIPRAQREHLPARGRLAPAQFLKLGRRLGRDPLELVRPAHARFEGVDFLQRRGGDEEEGDVPLGEVDGHALKLISQKRAPDATLVVVRAQHEVVYRQLALAAEELLEGLTSFVGGEHERLVDFEPGLGADLGVERVGLLHEGYFFGEERVSGGLPFVFGGDDWVGFEEI